MPFDNSLHFNPDTKLDDRTTNTAHIQTMFITSSQHKTQFHANCEVLLKIFNASINPVYTIFHLYSETGKGTVVEWFYRSHKDEMNIRPDQKVSGLLAGNNTNLTLIKDQSPVK